MAAADHRAALPREEEDEEEEVVESDDEEEGCDVGSEEEEDAAGLAGLCDPDAGSDEDPTFDPAADGDLEVDAVLRSRMARMSISARNGSKGSLMPKMGKEEIDLLAMVDKLMQDGQLEKLKVYECKAYLRMHKLRLSGNKLVLLNRIREHFEMKNMGEVKYPVSSFVLNCQGDSCKGDVVMFEQNIYKRKKGAPRGVKGCLCGQRTNAGRIIKESYGSKKQQHTFTIEILWSKGHKPWPPLHPLLIKGRDLYKDKTMRQPWPDEEGRNRVLQEKHARGFVARKTREVRIKEKEHERVRRLNRNKSKGHENMNKKSSQEILQQQSVTVNTAQQRSDEKIIHFFQHGEPRNTRQQQKSSNQIPTEKLFHYLPQFPYPQQHNEVLQKETSRTSTARVINLQAPSLQHAIKEETTQHQPESIKPTHIQQSSVYQQKYPKHQQHNEVLQRAPPSQEQRMAVSQTTVVRQDFPITHHLAPPSKHGGSESMRQQQISSRSTHSPSQQTVKYRQQPPDHQYKNEMSRQQCETSTSRTGFASHQSNHWGSTDHDRPGFQPHRAFTQRAKTHQHGTNGSGYQHARIDHKQHQPLRSRNKDYYWGDKSYDQDYSLGDQSYDQYYSQQSHHQNHHGHRQMSQYQYHYQNYHDRWKMNGNQYHAEENHNHTYRDHGRMNGNQNPPRFQPWRPCQYCRQGYCKYGENCKFWHD
ncbi:zinc finger CCCH domain-containing protein 62-like [Oryza brachyantha]|uniref:zinc finger CCCH domain-containing protein 62-like n=1 Tax=Oryza brachyantha TaxID=4533 RepID=UPI001ADA2BB8|nr:zinc finger CCCH domain-containing protein 62-like [Oryza brachyantha]